jgi:hypothetical protein
MRFSLEIQQIQPVSGRQEALAQGGIASIAILLIA